MIRELPKPRGAPLEFDEKSHGPATPKTPNWLKGSTWVAAIIFTAIFYLKRYLFHGAG